MAEKMSKTSNKGCEGKKSASLRHFLEKHKTFSSSCSLNIESSKLPCIDETTVRKQVRKHRGCEKVSSNDSDSRYWLKPGISLPKMHGTGKGDVPNQKRIPSTPSADSWKLDLPMRLVVPPEPSVTTPGGCFLRNRVKSEEFPRNVIGPSVCHSSFEVDCSVITDNDLRLDNETDEESSALKNWQNWMKIRRKQNNRFAEKLKRDKCELIMNAGDCLREVREEKDLLTYAQIPKLDKWRGSPKWWTEPVHLAQKGMKERYYVYETLYERGIIPPLESVVVPDVVKIEKDVACGDCNRTTNWAKSEYRKKREAEYSRQLGDMVSHKADARELIIIGQRIRPDEENESPVHYDLPAIEITLSESCNRHMEDDQSAYGVIHLVINGLDLYYGEYGGCKGFKPIKRGHVWSLIFEGAPVGTITDKTLFIENRGTVAVGYEWRKHRPDSYYSVFPPRKTSSSGPHFFFNKNPGVFLPGQKTEVDFHHHSKSPGYHTETWYLRLSPNIFAEKDSAIVKLVAVAGTRETLADFLKLDAYLDSCVKETIVRDVLWEIFERVRPEIPKDIEYRSLFMEEELFEYQNGSHYYRFDTVEELKSLFKQIPLQPQPEWDLNLFTLEDLIRLYTTGKQQREMMCRLMELSRSLLRPAPSKYKFDNKHKMLYNALCSIVEIIEVKAQRIRDVFSKMEGTNVDNTEFSEEEALRLWTVKSRTSYASSCTSLEAAEEGSLDSRTVSGNTEFKVTSKDIAHYRYVLHMMFFSYLCEAAELAAGVIESCKRFEHHGEVVTNENINFLCYDIV